jgi:1-acyl-sn-glycerol-3-phosphate acyltransferase
MTGATSARRLAGRLLRVAHRVDAQGMERVPATGGLILAVTHCGVRGGLILETCMQRDLTFLASGRFLRFALIRSIARRMGAVFVSPADLLDTRVLDEAAEVLAGGRLLGVMVQGRQMDQVAGPVKRGTAYLACRLAADILPIHVSRSGLRMRIRVGELLPPPACATAQAMNQTMAAVCAQLDIHGWAAG